MCLMLFRLIFADANKGGDDLEPEGAYTMTCPDQTLYKDLHNNIIIPKVTDNTLHDYLLPLGKRLGDTDRNMYKERYLHFVRVCNNNGNTYIQAVCHA